MTRDLTTTIQDLIQKDVLYPSVAVEFLLSSGPIRIWSGYGQVEYAGITFEGAGALLSVSPIEETSDLSAKGLSVVVSGLDASLIEKALVEPYQGRECNVYLILKNLSFLQQQDEDYILQENSGKIILEDGFMEIFSGEIDVMTVEDTGETCTISITAESTLIRLQRPAIRRLTHQDQQIRYPGDLGFRYVESLQDKEIVWGRED
jgi:hypothetical protein